MYQVIADQIDPIGNVVSTRSLDAISVDPVTVGNIPGVASVRTRAAGGLVVDIPVGGRPSEYQRVRVFRDGVLVDTLTYANGTIGHASGQLIER
jgi:hypothetical protein